MLSEMQGLSFNDGIEQVWSQDQFAALLSSDAVQVLVICVGELPVGFVLWRQAAEEAEILSIAILPTYRNKYFGSRLLAEFYSRLRSDAITEIFLEVRTNNQAAITLYTKNSFKIVGRRKKYYEGPHGIKLDALIMKYNFE